MRAAPRPSTGFWGFQGFFNNHKTLLVTQATRICQVGSGLPEFDRPDVSQGSTATPGVRAGHSPASAVLLWQRASAGHANAPEMTRTMLVLAQDHSDEVTAVTVHATGDYIVTASLDRTWAFYDVAAQICLTQVRPEAIEALYFLGF